MKGNRGQQPPTRGRPDRVSDAGRLTGVGAQGVARGGDGEQLLDFARPGHWARITGRGSGAKAHYYVHHAVAPTAAGGWKDLPLDSDWPWGDIEHWPAVEVRGRTDVRTDGTAVVWLEFDSFIPGWRFGDGVGAGLQVCGSPIPFAGDCVPCELTDEDAETFIDVGGILFDPCDFEVTETELCGGSDGGSGSGSSGGSGSGTSRRRAVRIRLKGKTEQVPGRGG